MELKEILDVKAVRYTSGVSSKKRLLQDIAEQAHAVYGLNAIEVFSALQEREALGSTGVGRGIAIPHARFESMNRVVGMFTRLEKPVDFDSVDHQPVDVELVVVLRVRDRRFQNLAHFAGDAPPRGPARSRCGCCRAGAASDPRDARG